MFSLTSEQICSPTSYCQIILKFSCTYEPNCEVWNEYKRRDHYVPWQIQTFILIPVSKLIRSTFSVFPLQTPYPWCVYYSIPPNVDLGMVRQYIWHVDDFYDINRFQLIIPLARYYHSEKQCYTFFKNCQNGQSFLSILNGSITI